MGEYFLYESLDSSKQIICIEKLTNSQKAVMDQIDSLKKQIFNKSEYAINKLDYSLEIQKNWCATQYCLRIFMEHPKNSLKNYVQQQRGLNMQEVTHLFYQMVSLNYEFQKRKEAHLKISPETIFVLAKNQFKLLLPQNNMSPFDYNRNKLFARQPIYVSPKLYLAIQKQHFQHLKFNESKNDVFALGLCILEAGLGRSVQGIYGVD